MRIKILLPFLLCLTQISKAQYLTKGMLLIDISGDYTSYESTINQGLPTYNKSYSVAPVFGVGLRIANQLYGYVNFGYGFGTDTTRQLFTVNNSLVPVSEKIKKSMPIWGFGFKNFYHIGETPFFFSTDFGASLGMGNLKGNLNYKYLNWGQEISVDLNSEGQHSIIRAGLIPGLAFFAKSGWFADLGIGFFGYYYENRGIEYADGFDDTSTIHSFSIDFSAATIKLRVGKMF